MDEDVDESIDEDHASSSAKSVESQSARFSPQSTLGVTTCHGRSRWTKLARLYNDRYLELFRESQVEPGSKQDLQESQFGSVIWTDTEKQKLFEALARKGRHDLQAISDNVGTKSVIEVHEYLHLLKEAENERHVFYKSVKQVSHAEMEAAVEIPPELEAKLEDAADALAAFQDHYDQAAARTKNSGLWLINSEHATQLDEENDARDQDNNGDLSTDEELLCLHFFKFGTMLDLSRTLFMNMPEARPHPHWQEVADDEEQPSITVDAVQDLFGLIKSITQRILQTAVFLAESRIRATTTLDYTPSRALKELDVVAALDILRMPASAFDYWPAYLKRSGVTIVVGGHKKGERSKKLSLEEAQKVLAVKYSEGRKMSVSRAVSVSSDAGRSTEEDALPPARQRAEDISNASPSISHDLASETSYSDAEDEGIESSDNDASEEGDTSDVAMQDHPNAHVSRKRRRRLLEQAEDEFMEKLDRLASMEEDRVLREDLGWPVVDEDVDVKLGRRPKKLRKMREDLKDWADLDYRPSWESGIYKHLANGVDGGQNSEQG